MGKLVPLFLLSDGMGQFVWEKLEHINVYKFFKYQSWILSAFMNFFNKKK